jgi:hypothetical protein
MRLLDYKRRPRVTVAAHGHPYERDPFMRMFDAFPEAEPFTVEHPVAPKLLNPAGVEDVDAIVFYDMPGGSPPRGARLLRRPELRPASLQRDQMGDRPEQAKRLRTPPLQPPSS